MNLALNTDFCSGVGCAEPHLRTMSEVGFTHVHWCHQWCTDFMYVASEMEVIKEWFERYGLTLLDVHGSVGPEKNWFSEVEYIRRAGVELVANRLRMHHFLGGTGTVMMHIPAIGSNTPEANKAAIWRQVDQLRKSLDELSPLIIELGVPIAVENMAYDTFQVIEKMLSEYPPEILGLCFDSGHGNIGDCRGLDHLDALKDRLSALHIHDNDGQGDQHQPPFYGTLDWERFAKILAASPYPREISFEVATRCTPYKEDIPEFARDAYERCLKFAKMVRG